MASAYQPYTNQPTGPRAWELGVGDYVEARIRYPLTTQSQTNPCANWGAFWARSTGPSTFAEIDIAECQTKLSIGYHASGFDNSTAATPTPVLKWENSWHTYGVYRTATHYYVYWDGIEVANVPATNDGHLPSALRFTMGYYAHAHNTVPGPDGDMLVDWVRGYTPANAPASGPM